MPHARIFNTVPNTRKGFSSNSPRITSFQMTAGRLITAGTPIGLLLSLTYASNIPSIVSGPRPVTRIKNE